jgi:hypothetical protein
MEFPVEARKALQIIRLHDFLDFVKFTGEAMQPGGKLWPAACGDVTFGLCGWNGSTWNIKVRECEKAALFHVEHRH